ncbi:hypothetical protein GCM10027073_63500 [Streptomyces chlorus]|uniref:Uncharacterized protein n=1 Tax=Streptomyces chlorus TaxID=887452 RepID=A0ABW1E693_9ACTN
MTLYRAILQFEEGGPAVTGEWQDNEAVARAAYKTWIGLYTRCPPVAGEPAPALTRAGRTARQTTEG